MDRWLATPLKIHEQNEYKTTSNTHPIGTHTEEKARSKRWKIFFPL
jgi:hypothetical protein